MPKEQILEMLKDNPDFIQEINDAFGKAEALEKVKQANAEIIAERETLKNDKRDLQAKIANAQKDSGSGNAELNALKEQLAAVQGEIQAAKSEADKARSEKRDTDLKNSVVGLEVAAKRSYNPNQLFTVMLADGLVGHGEDGKPYYHRINDKGEPVKAKSPEEAIDAFLKLNPHMEKSSGAQGSGQRPKTTESTGAFNPMDHL